MSEVVEQYLRRIHHAGGMPTEQAIDTTDASPRSRPLPPRQHSGRPFQASIS
jgi:hypothetical protein